MPVNISQLEAEISQLTSHFLSTEILTERSTWKCIFLVENTKLQEKNQSVLTGDSEEREAMIRTRLVAKWSKGTEVQAKVGKYVQKM